MKLNGSEKQVAWAQDILDNAEGTIRANMAKAEARLTEYPDVRRNQKVMKRIYKKGQKGRVDPIQHSLSENARSRREGDGLVYYCILPRELSADDIKDFCDDQTLTISSPYDCTGRLFTRWIVTNLTPAGWVFIHRMGVDI